MLTTQSETAKMIDDGSEDFWIGGRICFVTIYRVEYGVQSIYTIDTGYKDLQEKYLQSGAEWSGVDMEMEMEMKMDMDNGSWIMDHGSWMMNEWMINE